jgi:hypothetical protein
MGSLATTAPPRCAPPPVLFCAAHLRAGSHAPAYRVVDGEAFCRACFRGEPISPAEKLRRQSKSKRKNPQNFSHLPVNLRAPRDSKGLRADPPAVELLPGPTPIKQNHLAKRERSTDDIPASHRMSRLEVKLLNALQKLLLNEAKLLTAIERRKLLRRDVRADLSALGKSPYNLPRSSARRRRGLGILVPGEPH